MKHEGWGTNVVPLQIVRMQTEICPKFTRSENRLPECACHVTGRLSRLPVRRLISVSERTFSWPSMPFASTSD